jgi:hypothetical protein
MHDLACVVHLHSLHSDGTGTVPQIARAAKRAGVDVVLLTDHDTIEAKRQGEEGWHGSVLVLVGEEITPPRGNHTLAFGIDREIDHTGLSGAEICAAVHAAGGLCFAAHPFSRGSKRFARLGKGIPFDDLESEQLDGIELWSFVTDTAESLQSVPEALRFIARPNRVLQHPPQRNVHGWDALCRSRRVVAIGGLDAHQIGKRIGSVVPLRLMSYRRSFAQLRTHVLCDQAPSGDVVADSALVLGALREGSCYLAVDALAPARGFSFRAQGTDGDVSMGAEAPAGRFTLRATTPLPARLRLLRDGVEIATAAGIRLEHDVEGPGAYRVEARRTAHGRERTWVLSNPVYLR